MKFSGVLEERKKFLIYFFTKWRLKKFVKIYGTRQRGFIILIKENILATRKQNINMKAEKKRGGKN